MPLFVSHIWERVKGQRASTLYLGHVRALGWCVRYGIAEPYSFVIRRDFLKDFLFAVGTQQEILIGNVLVAVNRRFLTVGRCSTCSLREWEVHARRASIIAEYAR